MEDMTKKGKEGKLSSFEQVNNLADYYRVDP